VLFFIFTLIGGIAGFIQNIEFIRSYLSRNAAPDVDFEFIEFLVGHREGAPTLLRTSLLAINSDSDPIYVLEAVLGFDSGDNNIDCHFNRIQRSLGEEIGSVSRKVVECDVIIDWLIPDEVHELQKEICLIDIIFENVDRIKYRKVMNTNTCFDDI